MTPEQRETLAQELERVQVALRTLPTIGHQELAAALRAALVEPPALVALAYEPHGISRSSGRWQFEIWTEPYVNHLTVSVGRAVFERSCGTCTHFDKLGPSAHGLCALFSDNRDHDDGCLKGWEARTL